MRIRSVEEVATGYDEMLGDYIAARRQELGISRSEVAEATGAGLGELEMLEDGRIGMFSDPIRLRLVLLAYCEYLGLEAEPLLARLEPYARQQVLVPPERTASHTAAPDPPQGGRLTSAAAGFGVTMAVGLAAFYLAGML